MNEALMRIMKKDIDIKVAEGMEKGRAEGRAEGRTEGIMTTLISLVKEGLLSVQQAAARAKLPVSDFERLLSQSEG